MPTTRSKRVPIHVMAAYLISSSAGAPFIAIHRGTDVRFYDVTPASHSRLDDLLLDLTGTVRVTMHGWNWRKKKAAAS